ncbi:MAG: endonuclease III domain-containing protein [Phycisphaerae bacterium]|nr:endonuclease III domain-containing protein [Phycisphaerae bacterium]
MQNNKIMEIYQLLLDRFGQQHWWPGESEFEIMVGAILTQNTNWGNVEKAINNLKNANRLSPESLLKIQTAELAELIKPAGYYNIKAKRLKNFINWFFGQYNGKLEYLERVGTDTLREELLSIKGVGAETADSILLYALARNVFVVDTYTARIAARHQLIEPGADYEELQYLFESRLSSDTKLFNEYHALLVKLGKDYCKPKARCSNCPLKHLPYKLTFEY